MKRRINVNLAMLAVALAATMVLSGLVPSIFGDEARGEDVILTVGELDRMKTKNPLQALPQDIWTWDVLDLVYDTVGKIHPNTEEIVPYILKGIDVDDDGVFEEDEYGMFSKPDGGDQLNITAYYDFNGVYFHDGVQATVGDLFFSYHLAAMNPRTRGGLLSLMDEAGGVGSNYSATRWVFVTPAMNNWQNESLAGNPALRSAASFRLQEPFTLFYTKTLANLVLFPRHVWEGVGWRIDSENGDNVSPLHADFGLAIYPEGDAMFGIGVPLTETAYDPFVYLDSSTAAEDSAWEWQPADNDVIGTGPFIFKEYAGPIGTTQVFRNPLYFTGIDARTGVTLDQYLSTYIHLPFIDGVAFIVVPSTTLCGLLLEQGEIAYCHLNFLPTYLPILVNMWSSRIWTTPNPSFTYIGFNMRKATVGSWHWGQPDEFDVGYHFRKAIAHLIDKQSIVRNLLQGYGTPGIVPVSPWNKRFYNDTLTPYVYNLTQAQQELHLANADAVWLAANGGPSEAVSWYTIDPVSGKIIMPEIGTTKFSFACNQGFLAIWGDDDCEVINEEMWRLGFNVGLKAIGSDLPLLVLRESDMHSSGWRIADDDPDYLFDFFHSSNQAVGLNYVGFNDPLMDKILEDSRREMNETRRIVLLKWAQGIIADKLPYDTLYFGTNIEATRQDMFIGWLRLHGTIWNLWSLLNVRPPSTMRLHVSVESQSAVVAGEDAAITIKVRDQDDEPVDGVQVRATVAPSWAGNLSAGGGVAGNEITATVSLGKLTLIYTAPSVDRIINITITATVTYPPAQEILESSKSFVIVVYPAAAKFLGVTIRFLDTDIVPSSDAIWFEVSVTDRDGFSVPDSQATAAMHPPLEPPYGIDPSQWNGSVTTRLRFRAPPGSSMAANQTPIVMTVNVDSLDDGKGNASVVFLILRFFKSCPGGVNIPTDQACPSQDRIDGYTLVALTMIVGMGIAAVVSVATERVKKRRDIGRKES